MFDFQIHFSTLCPCKARLSGSDAGPTVKRAKRHSLSLNRIDFTPGARESALRCFSLASSRSGGSRARRPPDETWLPPGKPPVEVAVGFFLANLSGAAERSETFEADLYLSFRWHDPRLAFAGTEPKRFLEEAAVEQLQTMWWPHFEFVNTGAPDVANRALDISPDGSVSYKLAVTATFRSDLDLRRFPFDRETLEVRIQPFTWMRDQMIFVADSARIGFNPRSTYEELTVSRVSSEVRQRELSGWKPAESYSEFVALIEVERRPTFYVWTVFAPVMLIFLISCAIFAVGIENFHDRIAISLTAQLACIAMQFTVSFNLPQVSYLTVIRWMFLVTYFCITLGS
jgi:hypothetical protein